MNRGLATGAIAPSCRPAPRSYRPSLWGRFIALQVHRLLVEDLPGELMWLLEDQPAVLGVGVIAEIRDLVSEAQAVGIDHG